MTILDSRFIPARRQQGSTLTGIIIGLIIGLAIAVIVALVITKGSTPFTDKAKTGKAIEPTAGQVSDPNKPLYGNKDAAREANKNLVVRDAKPVGTDAQPAVATPKPDAAAAEPKAELPAKPAAPELAKPATAGAVPAGAGAGAAAVPADDKFVYYLQAGAFREVSDAENARAKLALLGFEAVISERATDSGVLHRVRLGPFSQVDTMNKARSKLSENGVDVAVVRNQK